MTRVYLDKRVRNVETDIMRKEKLVEEKSKIYNKAMEAKKLSVEQIKELRDLDYKIEKIQVDTRFEYEQTVEDIKTPVTFEQTVVKETCNDNWFLGKRCWNEEHTETKVEYKNKKVNNTKKIGEVPVYELKVPTISHIKT